MKQYLLISLALTIALFALGCGDDGGDDGNGGGGGVDGAIASLESAYQDTVVAECNCYYAEQTDSEGNLYASAQECIDGETVALDIGDFTACERDVLECYPSETQSVTSCFASALETYVSCISSCPASDSQELDDCEEALQAADCTSQALNEGMMQCEQSDSFTCE